MSIRLVLKIYSRAVQRNVKLAMYALLNSLLSAMKTESSQIYFNRESTQPSISQMLSFQSNQYKTINEILYILSVT